MALQLVIGNKNYSSWSMRPWVLMRQLDIAFTERKLRFDFTPGSAYRLEVATLSPSGLVPALLDDAAPGGPLQVWDTLAIAEYLHDLAPDAGVWPADRVLRARARCLAAEMHSGYGALRNHCGMNIEAALPDVGARVWAEQAGVRDNVARIETAWADALAASGGPFLCGGFSAADAMFAPVCMRFITYALPISDDARAYVQRVAAAPGVHAWISDALAEADFLDFEEPYRTSRAQRGT
jgi:glutathione S-transferase